ncbi:metal-dependent hydrolase [Pusillimonas sp. TS35]|uniref:metal-dependent hydrolase n=1 Tax=Paracandidimonas lactea TaxID=2895524 RepID=UPI00136EB0AF|nr:metal-dependent hydrolase [Paracandidimonas lactea]MYN14132.1 metal-dependent hydrolase [Pusillimonas sp. TS35]
MDSLTQAVLGAGIQGAMLGRFHGRKALAAGALLATLPDLDVFIDYGDPISGMIHHRGFSHSLFVLTAFAALLAVLYRYWRPRREYSAGWLFLTLWLVLGTHPLLDAFTSYGTQLWWPLRPTPTAWSSIFIIDPFFTLPLTLAVVAASIAGPRPGMVRALSWCLAWCALYLALSLGAKTLIESRTRAALAQQGAAVASLFSVPEPFNILLWRVAARTTDDHYIESIVSVLDEGPGEQIRLPLNSALAKDVNDPRLAGLQWFTGNWLRYDDVRGWLVVTDLRMGVSTGMYTFRFVVGRRIGPDNAWQTVTPEYWPRRRGTEELPRIMRRIWRQSPPLPLSQWERDMTALPRERLAD